MATPPQPHHPGASSAAPPTPTGGGPPSSSSGYKRASRKGAPRRFSCEHPGCDKLYSRAEHLQRHQLNHNPKEIFRCDVPGCDQKFVRADLLARHKKRHSASYIPRNRLPSFTTPRNGGRPNPQGHAGRGPPTSGDSPVMQPSRPSAASYHPATHQQPHPPPSSGPHDAAILLTPDSNAAPTPTSLASTTTAPGPSRSLGGHGPSPWAAAQASMEDMAVNIIRPKPGAYYPRVPESGHPHSHPHPHSHSQPPHAHSMPDGMPPIPFTSVQFPADEPLISRENFAVWLFDPQAPFSDFSVANIPFLEGGLESTFNNNIHYDYESLTSSRSQLDPTPPRQVESAMGGGYSDELLSEMRRQEVLHWFQNFRRKQPKYDTGVLTLAQESGGDLPGLNLEMMRDCLQEFWDHVSPRLPIVHQPTFSCNRCNIWLLMVMIALGASSLRGRDATGSLTEYGGFADVIIINVRWEILTAEEASPPVALWVAQALLLLEFYEKMYSSRKLHERAHIYHTATLTLLRRGSPLIGRAGSESPPDEERASMVPEDRHHPPGSAPPHGSGVTLDSRAWWTRWADSESMHRVVFAAFMMDIIHAAMFGHAADMAPHEIRLPLPCDDQLWTASSPDVVRSLDANFRMYGLKQVSFLDGLKSALHGKEVPTHSFGRMIIMSGLLSVGWHLSHRESHLKWLDLRTPSMDTQDNWRKILLRAFDEWKDSFDKATNMESTMPEPLPTTANGAPPHRNSGSLPASSNGPIQSAGLLYHLAHISLHVDIVDCQVYSGAKRLLGRKVSTRDYANAVIRMKSWSSQASTRHAVLHAFRLLHRVLVDPRPKKRSTTGFVTLPPLNPSVTGGDSVASHYSVRSEPDPHRPWIMYYAILSIWSFVCALHGSPPLPASRHGSSAGPIPPPLQSSRGQGSSGGPGSYRRISDYLSRVATLDELDERTASTLLDGLPELLDALQGILAGAHSELLEEATDRLKVCKDVLAGAMR